jgi:protein kinase A
MKIYDNILKGRVRYPPYVHPDAQDLMRQLITADLTRRLGNLAGGAEDIKNHPWFVEIINLKFWVQYITCGTK